MLVMKSIDTETGTAAHPSLSTERVHQIFSSIAHKYERFNAISSLGTHKNWVKKLCSVADIESSDTVIDIAGGTGEITFAVAKKHAPTHIVCTDLVPEMLDVARMHHKKGKGSESRISFQVADGQQLPFDNASFDAATMAYGLRNMPQREKALREVFRILKPGGSFTCLDFSTPVSPLLRVGYNVYLSYMIPFWGKLITGDANGFKYLAKSIKAYPDQVGIAKLFSEAGFTHVGWHNCSGGIACIHTGVKPL